MPEHEDRYRMIEQMDNTTVYSLIQAKYYELLAMPS